MEMAALTKPQIWAQVHANLTECPHCGKVVTVRTLRWRHKCHRRTIPQVLLDAERADLRRRELQQKVIDTLNARLQGNGGQTRADGGADQADMGGT